VIFSYLGNIWKTTLDGNNPRPLTLSQNNDANPTFSPDGTRIGFSRDYAGYPDVFVMPSQGGEPKRLTFHSGGSALTGWTNDATRILYRAYRPLQFPQRIQLFTISVQGGIEERVPVDMGTVASYSPDGNALTFNRRSVSANRKGYRGPANTEVWTYNFQSQEFTQLTDFDGFDRWPLWASNGYIYFVSDRDGVFNLYKIPETGEDCNPITAFENDDIENPKLSTDRSRISFEQDHKLWYLNLDDEIPHEIPLNFFVPKRNSQPIYHEFNSQANEFSIAPTSQRVALVNRGEVIITPLGEGDTVNLTESPERENGAVWSPDGKWIAYVSDPNGQEDVFLCDSHGRQKRQLTNRDSQVYGILWAPDTSYLIIAESAGKIFRYEMESGEESLIFTSPWGYVDEAQISPDGEWIMLVDSREDGIDREIFLMRSKGGKLFNLTDDPSHDRSARFGPEGKYITFVSNRSGSNQVYYLPLQPLEEDIFDPELEVREAEEKFYEAQKKKEEDAQTENQSEDESEEEGEDQTDPPVDADSTEEDTDSNDSESSEDSKIEEESPEVDENTEESETERSPTHPYDLTNLKTRLRQLTHFQIPIHYAIPSADGKTVYFVVTEIGATSRNNALYKVDLKGETSKLFSAGSLGGLTETPDKSKLVYIDGGRLHMFNLPNGPAAVVPYKLRVQVSLREEWEQMFWEAHRIIKHQFYDPNLHNIDWERMGEKYQVLLDYVDSAFEVVAIIGEMFGELNASHMYAVRWKGHLFSTKYFGFDVVREDDVPYYRVGHIYDEGPADHDYVKIEEGNYILKVNGVPLSSEEDWAQRMNQVIGSRAEFTLNESPTLQDSWETRISPISFGGMMGLMYQKWVRTNRAYVMDKSDGRIGYAHIAGMGHGNYLEFLRDLNRHYNEDALIIDVRYNGGGNIEEALIDVLERRPYQINRYRDFQETPRPGLGFFGPIAVLINESCYSNAEMFPQAVKDRELGTIIGVPTYGAVIGVSLYGLIDGSFIGVPSSGVYRLDGVSLENNPVQPDIYVDNSPKDNLAGFDRQLETAIDFLLGELEEKEQDN